MSQKVQIMRIVQLAANHAKVIISMTISEFYDKIWYGLPHQFFFISTIHETTISLVEKTLQ